MFSYQQISRWVSFNADPLSVEDWLGNREVFGPVEKPNDTDLELEKAFLIEKEKMNDGGVKGIYEQEFLLLICAKGKGEKVAFEAQWSSGMEKKTKKAHVFAPGEAIINSSAENETKLNVKCQNGFKIAGKNEFVFKAAGKTKIIIDAMNI